MFDRIQRFTQGFGKVNRIKHCNFMQSQKPWQVLLNNFFLLHVHRTTACWNALELFPKPSGLALYDDTHVLVFMNRRVRSTKSLHTDLAISETKIRPLPAPAVLLVFLSQVETPWLQFQSRTRNHLVNSYLRRSCNTGRESARRCRVPLQIQCS